MASTRRRAQQISRDFERADLGDDRLTKRAVDIVERLAKHPDLPLPEAMGSTGALEGAYRFMGNDAVGFAALLDCQRGGTVDRARAVESKEVLVIHDTTSLQFGDRDPEELGYLQTGKAGFLLHTSLVIDSGLWRRPLGIVYAETLHRAERSRRGGRRRKVPASVTVTWKDRESLRWIRGVEASASALRGVCSAIHVADSEGDNYQLLARLVELESRFVVRVRYDRKARAPEANDWGKLSDVVATLQGRLTRTVPLARRGAKTAPVARKAHPPRDSRSAELVYSAGRVEIPRPHYLSSGPATLTVNVVHVVEENPPAGEEPVEWLLYTTEAIASKNDIARVVDIYRNRWATEEFYKALKTGCLYEERGFESRHSLLTMLALSLPIACELLWMRSRARTDPDASATEILSQQQLAILRRLNGKLPATATAQQALLALAALGGHQRSNGDPGWQVLQRGWNHLKSCEVGWLLAKSASRRGKM